MTIKWHTTEKPKLWGAGELPETTYSVLILANCLVWLTKENVMSYSWILADDVCLFFFLKNSVFLMFLFKYMDWCIFSEEFR